VSRIFTTEQSFTEVLCLLGWDERLARAMRRALADYDAAGRPGMPMGSNDFRKTFAALPEKEKKKLRTSKPT
jgi:hypothetical protein